MASNVTQTTRQDLPEWAQPLGLGNMELMLQYLFPHGKWVPAPDSPFKNKTKFDYGDIMPSMDALGMPLQPGLTPKTGLEKSGEQYALNEIYKQEPINDASKQWMLDTLGGENTDLANQYDTYLVGGPLAGASRAGLLNSLTGNNQELSQNAIADALYGKSANSATNAAYNTLGQQRDLATDASISNFTGQNAGTARKTALDTMLGKYLYPNSNPYLAATAQSAGKSLADTYRYATGPGTDAAFARAGSFGGSAHQQTKDMQKFQLGQNLSDLENNIYEGNYQQERGNQLNVANQQDAAANASLEAERGRQYGTQSQLLQQQLAAAMDQQQGYRSLLDNSLTRGSSAAESQLGRGVQAQSMLPALQQAGYVPSDILRSLGASDRNMQDQQNQIDFTNKQTIASFPFQIMNYLNSQLASSTGGQGVTTTTGANPNANSGVATGVGAGAAGIGLLSQLGQTLWGRGAPAGGTPPGIFS